MLRRVAAVLLIFGTWAPTARAQDRRSLVPVWADGRQYWTLLDRRLMNRELLHQIDAPQQAFRLCHGCAPATVAADTAVGAQVVTAGIEQSRFHGFFVVDAFAGALPWPSVDVSLDLTMLNPSASDGYRVSDQVLPGFALYFHPNLFVFGGIPLQAHLLALDLDVVTIGRGLLLEEVPLEGHMAGLSWNGIELREAFGGRVFWNNDDLLSVSASALDRAVELIYTAWMFDYDWAHGARQVVSYLGVAGQIVPHPTVRVAGEYQMRIESSGRLRHAGLLRADYLNLELWVLELHVGYQARYYQNGFGPRDDLVPPSTLPNVPLRTAAYVTNSFEFFGPTDAFDQVSQTMMLELRAPWSSYLRLYANVELWARWLGGPSDTALRRRLAPGQVEPGWDVEVLLTAGLELRPWAPAPHRLRVLLTNKQVAVGTSVLDPELDRFVTDPLLLVTAEYFL